MKKFNVILALLFLGLIISGEAHAQGNQATLLAVINPSNWGLDNVITQVVAALATFVIGLFMKRPTDRKKKKDIEN